MQLKLAWILRGSVLLRPVDEGVRVLSQVEEGATQSSGGDRVKIVTVFVMSSSELLIKRIMIILNIAIIRLICIITILLLLIVIIFMMIIMIIVIT